LCKFFVFQIEVGFVRDEPVKRLTIGYGKDTLLGVASSVIKVLVFSFSVVQPFLCVVFKKPKITLGD
jgi:hypothetical protein